MFDDTQSQQAAEEKARALGAVSVRYALYPWHPYHGNSGVFAHYYFNRAGDEVGHYIPDMNSFTEFTPPRKWSHEMLSELGDEVDIPEELK
jgi:hypothetical protein